MSDWLAMSASNMGRAIGRGEIDPVDLLQAHFEAIAAHPLRDRIYARLTVERAEAEAEAASARAKSGHRLGALDGVPISWKDLYDTAGVATEAGSLLLKGRVPTRDAEVLRNATAAGLVCLGKTHMTELAFSGLGLNPSTASPPNVNDPEGISGGSSSGAATSVAFGLAACGIGSDTGGSVRIPSAWNDLVGLKTSHGRLSLDGVVPLCATFDTVGPLARTVEDAAEMLAVLEGSRAVDLRGADVAGQRFASLRTVALEDVRAEPLAAYQSALERLREAGAIVEEIDAPEVSEAMAIAGPLFTVDAYGRWRDAIEAQPELMYDRVRERFRAGAGFSGPDYIAAWIKLEELRARWEVWPQVPAVKQNRLHIVDADLFDRPSPRLIDALEYLVVLLHPELDEAQ
jgi:aspartyl-tRNA(Asn)/glutamyl-tRNA(Gln) amidotransferase subunit A